MWMRTGGVRRRARSTNPGAMCDSFCSRRSLKSRSKSLASVLAWPVSAGTETNLAGQRLRPSMPTRRPADAPDRAIVSKGLTVRSADPGQRYIPMLLERIAAGEIPTRDLLTHPSPSSRGRTATTSSNTRRTDVCARRFAPERT